jgi:WD40 repeat protein
LWEVATGHELRRLGRQDTDVEAVAFAPDSRSALSAGSDGIVRLWNVQTGEMIRTFEGHKGAVHDVAFSPDGRLVLACGADKMLRLWDTATGNTMRTLEGHTDAVWSAAFHPDGQRIVSAGADRTLRLWDTDSGKERPDFRKPHAGWVVCVAFRRDGAAILSGSVDGLIRLWDAETGKLTQRRISLPVATSHERRLVSLLPVSACLPSGENARDISFPGPTARRRISSPVSASHRRTVESKPPDRIYSPLGEKATGWTSDVCPLSTSSSPARSLGWLRGFVEMRGKAHQRRLKSRPLTHWSSRLAPPAERTCRPSGATASASTPSVWPVSFRSSCPEAVSQRRIVRSALVETI